MSGRIVREVLEHAPEDLTTGEMLVFITLAEAARESSRAVCEPATEIAARARVSVSTVNKTTYELHRRGLLSRTNKARTGVTQRYEIAPLRPEHRFATTRSIPAREGTSFSVPEDTGQLEPVDNPGRVFPLSTVSLPNQQVEPSPKEDLSVLPPYKLHPRDWWMVTTSVAGYPHEHASEGSAMSSGWTKRRPAAKNRALYGSQAWRNVRLVVLARDGWTCQVRQSPKCQPDLRLPRNAHVDHVLPVAQGGAALHPWNLRASCGPCNVLLGARLGRSRQTNPPRPPWREY